MTQMQTTARLFQPLQLGKLTLRNRIVLPPMCQYMASTEEGRVTEYHLAHYGVRALSGLGLIIVEATGIEPDGRLSGNDLGLWEDEQLPGMRRLAEVISANGAVPGIQLNHAGRKAWPGAQRLVAPSPLPFDSGQRTPHELTPAEMEGIAARFAAAAQRAAAAGFKLIELHGAHGYLLSEFLSPLVNRREDEFGGALENRWRFPLMVVEAVKQVLPEDVVLGIRLSAEDYAEGGNTTEDCVQISRALEQAGIQLLHISTGGVVPVKPPAWPGYQLPCAKAVRQAVSIPVIGVGILEQPFLADFAIRLGYCDLVAIGRGYLRDPHWAVTAARSLHEEPMLPESMLAGLLR